MAYSFLNGEHTLVRNSTDNSTFELPPHAHPSTVGGFAGEQWRRDGCPWPTAFTVPSGTYTWANAGHTEVTNTATGANFSVRTSWA